MSASPQCSRRLYFLSLVISIALVAVGPSNTAFAQASQLVCSPCAVNFGNVSVGGSQALPMTFTNSGSSSITISSKDKTGPWFYFSRGLSLPYTLRAGQAITFNMVYAPTVNKATSGSFTFHSNASNSALVVTVSGTGVAAGTLAATPSTLGFGRIPIGSSISKTLTVTNPGSSALTVTQISSSGGSLASAFTTSGIAAPLTLTAGQSITFQVTFAPQSMGDFFGNLSLVSSSGGQISVAENGVGMNAGALSLTPGSLNFGNVVVGTSQSQTLTLSASSAQVTVSSDSLGSSEYAVHGVTLPLTLAPGQTVPVTVTFTPQATGAASSQLTFATPAGIPVLAALNGNGVAPAQHSVTLSWQSSKSQVAGYNVYRGGQSTGPFDKINASTDASTTFSDEGVQGGNSYYYQVTSVDGSGMESLPSSPVAASVPNP